MNPQIGKGEELGQQAPRGASFEALENALARMTDRVRALESELSVVKEQRDKALAASK